jgi:hypothetical protein
MFPPTVNFTGAVTYHLPDNDFGLRMFGIDLSIYKEKQGSQTITENSRILCQFDNENQRWKLFKLPPLNRILHVTGVILGFYKVASSVSLCLLVSELSFISSSPSTVAPPTPASAVSSLSKGRPKIWGGISMSPQTPKKRRLSISEPESSTSVTLQEQRASESPSPSLLRELSAVAKEVHSKKVESRQTRGGNKRLT